VRKYRDQNVFFAINQCPQQIQVQCGMYIRLVECILGYYVT